MESTSFHSFLTQEVSQDSSRIERPGPAFEELCQLFPLQKIKNRAHHEVALKIVTKVSEFVNDQKIEREMKKQILNYLEALGLLIEEYEKENFAAELEKISGAQVLEFLMEQQDLKQGDLAKELGSQSIVSEILSGKRKLNSKQIRALSKRFGVSPACFYHT